MIWKSNLNLDSLNSRYRSTIHESLGIWFTDFGDDFLEAEMPVDQRTKQPAGLLHGGASVVLAESLGSLASCLVNGLNESSCVGIEINASHLRAVRSGSVIGRVKPIRTGRTLHVWEIKIAENLPDRHFEEKPLTCISRLTVSIRI